MYLKDLSLPSHERTHTHTSTIRTTQTLPPPNLEEVIDELQQVGRKFLQYMKLAESQHQEVKASGYVVHARLV